MRLDNLKLLDEGFQIENNDYGMTVPPAIKQAPVIDFQGSGLISDVITQTPGVKPLSKTDNAFRYSGSVMDNTDGSRLASATVKFMPSGKQILADAKGVFSAYFNEPQNGVVISSAGYEKRAHPIDELKTLFPMNRAIKTLQGVTVKAAKKPVAKQSSFPIHILLIAGVLAYIILKK